MLEPELKDGKTIRSGLPESSYLQMSLLFKKFLFPLSRVLKTRIFCLLSLSFIVSRKMDH